MCTDTLMYQEIVDHSVRHLSFNLLHTATSIAVEIERVPSNLAIRL